MPSQETETSCSVTCDLSLLEGAILKHFDTTIPLTASGRGQLSDLLRQLEGAMERIPVDEYSWLRWKRKLALYQRGLTLGRLPEPVKWSRPSADDGEEEEEEGDARERTRAGKLKHRRLSAEDDARRRGASLPCDAEVLPPAKKKNTRRARGRTRARRQATGKADWTVSSWTRPADDEVVFKPPPAAPAVAPEPPTGPPTRPPPTINRQFLKYICRYVGSAMLPNGTFPPGGGSSLGRSLSPVNELPPTPGLPSPSPSEDTDMEALIRAFALLTI